MIGRIRGEVLEDQVVFTAGGVGYRVRSLDDLVEGANVDLHVVTVTGEKDVTLYGFTERREADLFRRLRKVPGCGAGMALNLIRTLGADGTVGAIRERQVATLSRTPGVGRKTAERLTLAADRFADWEVVDGPDAEVAGTRAALGALGFTDEEIRDALRNVNGDGDPLAAALAWLRRQEQDA